MKLKLRHYWLIGALLIVAGLIFTLYLNNDDRILLLLTNQTVADAADIKSVDYLPEDSSYFAFIDFELPADVRQDWLFLSYRQSDCQVFRDLATTGNLKSDWEEMLQTGQCYENKVLIRNPIASYNEVSVVVEGDSVLIYAAGIDDPAFFL